MSKFENNFQNEIGQTKTHNKPSFQSKRACKSKALNFKMLTQYYFSATYLALKMDQKYRPGQPNRDFFKTAIFMYIMLQ